MCHGIFRGSGSVKTVRMILISEDCYDRKVFVIEKVMASLVVLSVVVVWM